MNHEAAEIVAELKHDLARRAGVPTEAILLKQIERIDWGDASLGFPQKNKVYAQLLTPGYRIVLTAGNMDFEYHTDTSGKTTQYCSSKKTR